MKNKKPKATKEKPVLKMNTPLDYTLDGNSVWLTVKGFSVYVQKTDEGISVDIYPLDNEAARESLASCYAFDSELESDDAAPAPIQPISQGLVNAAARAMEVIPEDELEEYSDYGEDNEFPRLYWERETGNGITNLSYWEWVNLQKKKKLNHES